MKSPIELIGIVYIIQYIIIQVQINKLKKLTIKNNNNNMATLQDFQTAAAEITAATTTITTYIQGTGMTSAEQDEALASINSAIATLKGIIPGGAEPTAPTE